MARLILVGKSFEKFPPQVEDELRKELGLTHAISYTVESSEAGNSKLQDEAASQAFKMFGKTLIDGFTGLFGQTALAAGNLLAALGAVAVGASSSAALEVREKQWVLSGIIRFDIDQPRPAVLFTRILRKGPLSVVGTLVYVTTLRKPVNGEVRIEREGLVHPNLSGDFQTAERLRGNSQLVKRIGKFTRTELESTLSGANPFPFALSIKASFRIIPQGQSSLVVAQTLPVRRDFVLTRAYRLNAEEFFAIVDTLEAWL